MLFIRVYIFTYYILRLCLFSSLVFHDVVQAFDRACHPRFLPTAYYLILNRILFETFLCVFCGNYYFPSFQNSCGYFLSNNFIASVLYTKIIAAQTLFSFTSMTIFSLTNTRFWPIAPTNLI